MSTITIPLKGVVGFEITPAYVTEKLSNVSHNDAVVFEVNSPGGSVTDGFEIYNQIKNLEAESKTFEISGIAMSIMSLIIMAGDQINGNEVSMLMIHKSSVGLEGNSDELKKQASTLDKIDEILVELYYNRNQAKGTTKLGREQIMEMLSAETFMTPNEALEYGFIDAITNKSDYKAAAYAKDLLTNNKSKMKHLEKLRSLLALGGRPTIKDEAVKDAFIKALGERKFLALDDAEQAEVKSMVKADIESLVGSELTEEEAAQVKAVTDSAIEELTVADGEAEETSEEVEAIKAEQVEQKELLTEIGTALLKQGELMENINTELTAMKKGIRSFSKKPFVNELAKGGATGYVDRFAKHREEMVEIEARTRNAKRITTHN